MKAFDFFCGAGGLTHGLRNAGIKVTAGVDNDIRCGTTYEHNNHGAKFIHKSMAHVELEDLELDGPLPKNNNVLFAGCAPCQPFSSHRKDSRQRPEATLLSQFGRLVCAAMPSYVLLENVPGLAKVRGFSTFRRFLGILDKCNYRYVFSVLDAQYYGVPQRRRRLVLLATRKKQISLPEPKHGDGLRPVKTVRHAIAGFPPITAGECHSTVLNHVAAHITEINLRRLQATPINGGDRRSWPPRLRLACHANSHQGHTDVYGRMHWDKPAPALTGKCTSISNGRYGHPEQNRAISLREAAALQSFPDEYEFFGYSKSISTQIGNAVPVKLAEEIGKHILQLAAANN